MKKSFVLYTDKYEAIRFLSQEQKGNLLDAIYLYASGEELPEMDDFTRAMFVLIRQGLDENDKKYIQKVEKLRKAGKKGGLASGIKRANEANASKNEANEANASKNEANEAVTVTVTVTDTDINTPNGVFKAAKPPKHKYGEYENVLLTDSDLEKLKKEFPDWQARIEKLSEYMKSTGKVYKDHLATIRSWARRDKKKPQQPKPVNSFHNFTERKYDYDELMERIREKNRA